MPRKTEPVIEPTADEVTRVMKLLGRRGGQSKSERKLAALAKTREERLARIRAGVAQV